MAQAITSALAVGFDYAGETVGLTLSGVAYTATVPAVTGARVLLAASGYDLVRVLQTALNAPAPALPGGVSFAVTMGATGLVTITCTGDTFKINAFASNIVAAILGFTSNLTNYVASATAAYAPKYLILMCARMSSGWSPKTPVAAAVTIGGVSYGVTSGITRDEDELTSELHPSDPTFATSLGQSVTPWEPDAANLAARGAHAVPWSVSDCLAVALGKTCGLARGNFQTLRTSTTARFDLVALDGDSLSQPRVTYQVPGWDAYRSWTFAAVRQSTAPTGTRA